MADVKSIPQLAIERPMAEGLLIRVSGDWRNQETVSDIRIVREALSEPPAIRAVEFDTGGLSGWDSRFVAFVNKCAELSRERQIEVRGDGLPDGVRRLLRLAEAVREKDTHRTEIKAPFFARLGTRAAERCHGAVEVFTFLGQNILALTNLVRGRAQLRWSDAFLVMEQTGPKALGIVALINFLVGLILAFVGALQLARFGASIYVADLVGIATVREMGCVMTGIILSGRTGAAFAAQLGTMKVNEEINALRTFGFSPIEYLVLPRMIALILMMPFLCLFADLISIAGGFCVSISMLDITPTVYIDRTIAAIDLKGFLLGIVKGSFFGFLVACTGCLRGMQSGHTAAAVGEATTRAVVAGITAIVAADGVFAVISNTLHI